MISQGTLSGNRTIHDSCRSIAIRGIRGRRGRDLNGTSTWLESHRMTTPAIMSDAKYAVWGDLVRGLGTVDP
jgi:hypothetical protein